MNKSTERLLLLIIIIVFLALRIAFITQKNLWFDEVFSWNLTLGSFSEIIGRTSLDIHPPLYYFVLKVWNFLFGDSVFSMRFLSALFSVSSLIFLYPLAKRILGPANSFIVLLLFAINPLNIFYSQETRMSAMNLFLNTGSVYFLLKMLDKNQIWKQHFKQGDVYFYVLFRTAALYTHYFSFFIFIAEIIIISYYSGRELIHTSSTKKNNIIVIFCSFAAIFILYLPWIPTFLVHITRGQTWRYGQFIHSPFRELLNFIKDMNLGLYYHYTNLNIINYITIILVILFIISFGISFISNKKKDFSRSYIIPLILVLLPIVFAMILTIRQRIEFYRYLSIIIPYVIIVIVYGISKINKKYIVVPLLSILMMINLYGLTIQYSFDFKNDDYRPLIQHIDSNYKSGDRIYVEPHYMGWSVNYYRKQWDLKLPDPVYIRYGWKEILDSINVQSHERFWLVLDYSALDTTQFSVYISGLSNKYKAEVKDTYYLAPSKVELYRFKK